MDIPLQKLVDYIFDDLAEVDKTVVKNHLLVDDFDREIVIGLEILKNRLIHKEEVIKFLQKKSEEIKKNTLDQIDPM